ncbi:uncharacterized protein LOC133928896 isoform X1 [Phragmites australis]|uniref:uncharacterized protein LOC133928896 isoform X1 n=1 Tax=Phragmites australis TaxID=29695 RepID=UPI002D77586B|nr:uncharacterized protein LOC133928896 isoform X1 [Phragmites australis]
MHSLGCHSKRDQHNACQYSSVANWKSPSLLSRPGCHSKRDEQNACQYSSVANRTSPSLLFRSVNLCLPMRRNSQEKTPSLPLEHPYIIHVHCRKGNEKGAKFMELACWTDDLVINEPAKLFLKCVDFNGHESISGQHEELEFQ